MGNNQTPEELERERIKKIEKKNKKAKKPKKVQCPRCNYIVVTKVEEECNEIAICLLLKTMHML